MFGQTMLVRLATEHFAGQTRYRKTMFDQLARSQVLIPVPLRIGSYFQTETGRKECFQCYNEHCSRNHFVHKDSTRNTYPEIADVGLLAILDPSFSLVGTSRVTPVASSTLAPSFVFSAELCGRIPNWEPDRYQDTPLGCGTGGAEGDRSTEVFLSHPDERVPGTERADWDIERRLARDKMRNGWEIPTATR